LIHPVLIVEDDRKIARVVALYLEEAGYRVAVAEDGQRALDAAAKEKPLLVILDLILPDMGGEQVIQELRALGDVPVIILTSKSSEEDRVVGFALGADDYVVKPFSPRELVTVADKHGIRPWGRGHGRGMMRGWDEAGYARGSGCGCGWW
jgi:DNA-binding response OmpR family regulator